MHSPYFPPQVTELEWPVEMIQETSSEPPIAWSCNPLAFDFTQLFMKPTKPKKPETVRGDQETGAKPTGTDRDVENSQSADNGMKYYFAMSLAWWIFLYKLLSGLK